MCGGGLGWEGAARAAGRQASANRRNEEEALKVAGGGDTRADEIDQVAEEMGRGEPGVA